MKIAVALLTCDRFDLTKITVESFESMNPSCGFLRYYADDASASQQETTAFLEARGYVPLLLNRDRGGCSPTTEELVSRIVTLNRDLDLILYLQNDFESVRPVPMDAVEQAFRDPFVGAFRLGGKWKMPGKEQTEEKWFRPTIWYESMLAGERVQFGHSPFYYNPPSFIRPHLFLTMLAGATREKEVSTRSNLMPYLTFRVVDNVTHHIGWDRRTPGGIYESDKSAAVARNASWSQFFLQNPPWRGQIVLGPDGKFFLCRGKYRGKGDLLTLSWDDGRETTFDMTTGLGSGSMRIDPA